jgi:hypothetical protein
MCRHGITSASKISGAMTIRVTKQHIMPLSKLILGLITQSKTPFYITTLDKISFGIMAFGKVTQGKMSA